MNIYLGIDIGTSKICVLALEADTKKPIEIISGENRSNLKTKDDFSEQEPMRIKQIVFDLINKIKKRIKSKITAIGITGQMHGMLFTDKNLKPLSNLITWQDKRSEKLIPEIYQKTKDIKYYECGCHTKPGYMGATLYWFYKNKLIPKNLHRVCFISDWIAANLIQENEVFTDSTHAASSGIFDIKKMGWHWRLIEKLGIKKEIFPKIKNHGEIIGFTKEGIPVNCILGDNQASVFGSTHEHDERECIILNIGTGAQVSIVINNFVKTVDSLELRPYLDEKYILVGASLNGGAVYSLLKDFFVSIGSSFWRISKEDLFEKMNKLASKVPKNCNGLICYPYFFGERGKNDIRASFVGLNIHNFTAAHLCRAILEGVVKVLYNLYKETGEKRKYIIGSGNAIKKNKVLQEIIKDTFNMDLKLSPYDEEAAYGAALLAAKIQC